MDLFNNVHCISVTGANVDSDEIRFVLANGTTLRMYHPQNCCESVYVEDIVGNLAETTNFVIHKCDEKTNSDIPEDEERNYASVTWTFYTLHTSLGYFDIRWCGESNGYYSEDVYVESEPWALDDITLHILKTYPELVI